jgi:single-stranded DNA-binding protein
MTEFTPQNAVLLRGTLKRKSELVAGESGKNRITFTVTVPRGKTGLFDFVSCVAFGDAAENVDSIRVGNFVAIEGGVRSSSWTTSEGVKRFVQEVAAWKVSAYGATDTTTPPTFTGGAR